MHRAMEITVLPATTDSLIGKLDGLIGLSVRRGPSIVPSGDVLTVHALSRDADRIMRLAAAVQDGGQISVATHELSSIVDPDKERAVANDLDEALWEESETTLRHQGRVTANYLTLMALGGAVATTGFIVGSPSQAIFVVAASVISPGFEPLAKVPMDLALRRWGVVGRGLWSAGVGYLVLALVLAAGKPALAYQWAERFFLDVLLIIAGGAIVVLLKQTIVHRRAPMV